MIGTLAGIMVTVLFMGFSMYRTVLGIMPIVDWLMDTPKYVHAIRNLSARPGLPKEAH